MTILDRFKRNKDEGKTPMQWYEKRPELYRAEVALMLEKWPQARFFEGDNGDKFCLVEVEPEIMGSLHKYTLLLRYLPDHPKRTWGTSVRCYLVKPTLNDMLDRVIAAGVDPPTLPHVLTKEEGDCDHFICTFDPYRSSANADTEITSGAQSVAFACRWLNIFEMGLKNKNIWEDFNNHGVI